jgi:myo-inositol catabolism protein IolC
LFRQKRSWQLLPYTLCFDPHQQLEQMASLATALTTVGVVFTDKLLYSLAHQLANNAKLEKGGMQVMGKEGKGTMEACKAMCSGGEWPPLLVTYDSPELALN